MISNEKNTIDSVLQLAESCRYEKDHSHQVARLALRFFDELKDLHKLGLKERFYLQAAGLLHDIGWIKGRLDHHKTTRDIIIGSTQLPFSKTERAIVALIARYHRGSFPQDAQKYFSELSVEEKDAVRKLASFLRMADGLDRSHISSVENLACELPPQKLIVKIKSRQFPADDRLFGKKKADLFEEVFKREVEIQ